MSLQTLGERVGVAPSHVYHVEKGDKVPSESLAMQLARALGEDPDLFRAWARARSRTDVYTALDSARVVARYLQAGEAQDSAAGPSWARPLAPAAADESREHAIEAAPDAPRPTRLLVPVLDPADPGAPRPIETLRLTPRALDLVTPLERPFALPLTAAVARRVAGQLPADGYAIVTRFRPPVDPRETYAVRLDGHLELARALWNGHQLLLLPAPGQSDFAILPAVSNDDLDRHVAGRVALVRAGART